MTIRNVTQAKEQLSALLHLVECGEEVVISRGDKPVARLVPVQAAPAPRTPGALKGRLRIADDFDAPSPEIEAMFYGKRD